MTLWIAGQHTDTEKQWQFQGVFASQARAEAACRDSNYFIARVELDEELPHERTEWSPDEAWYPSEGSPETQADGVAS